MHTERIHLPAMLLGGVGFYGDPFHQKGGWDSENEIGHAFERFSAFAAQHSERPYSSGREVLYELHIYGSETQSKGRFEVFIGEEVNTPILPIALCSKYLPAADYLKLTLFGDEISGDWWQALSTEILPSLRLKQSAPYIIQTYDHRFKGTDRIAESVIDAYIPVEEI
ncbi:MAG TPA: GyrI-like domain-containing protein [Candidatus Limiplasma sp.]|nr:GyrI-like domain-containing protein [Candidatus Limiplasma sp.]HRX07905.1 GyrI-like domain-containing protein [Candidatus Limiplasma sp.]